MGAALDPESELPTPSILLVDDRPSELLALEAVLETLGYRLVQAHSGEEALRCLLKEEFALILMDVQMPGLDGYSTVALIKQRKRDHQAPVIFMSAVSKEAEDISKGYEYGAIDYITKPFDPDILRAKVSVLMALHMQAERIARQREQLAEERGLLAKQVADREAAERAARTKDEFLALVSHELRTPLNAIVGWSDLLVGGQLDGSRARAAIESIRRNAQLQTLLVDDLIAMSQVLRGELRLQVEPVSLRSVIEAAIDTLGPSAAAKGIRMQAHLADVEACRGDPKRLLQVFANLLSNAVKFTPAGGLVTITLSEHDGELLQVEITDTGIGIRPDALPRIFDRFWQDRSRPGSEHGLGLGLAIVRQLVEFHRGTVRAESSGEGAGTTITVRLPRRARVSDAQPLSA